MLLSLRTFILPVSTSNDVDLLFYVGSIVFLYHVVNQRLWVVTQDNNPRIVPTRSTAEHTCIITLRGVTFHHKLCRNPELDHLLLLLQLGHGHHFFASLTSAPVLGLCLLFSCLGLARGTWISRGGLRRWQLLLDRKLELPHVCGVDCQLGAAHGTRTAPAGVEGPRQRPRRQLQVDAVPAVEIPPRRFPLRSRPGYLGGWCSARWRWWWWWW